MQKNSKIGPRLDIPIGPESFALYRIYFHALTFPKLTFGDTINDKHVQLWSFYIANKPLQLKKKFKLKSYSKPK